MSPSLRRFLPSDLAGRAAALSFATAFGLMATKVAAGLASGSVAVLSDGLDSAQDCLAAAIAFASVRYGARPPDLAHPYGHGRAETIAAGIQSLLIAGGGAYVIYRSVDRWVNPPGSIDVGLGLGVMVATIVVNLVVWQYARRVADLTNSPAIMSDARHLMTNVVQGACVLLGLILVAVTGWLRADAVAAFGLGLYLLWTAGAILWSTLGDVLDTSLTPDEVQFVEEAALVEQGTISGFHRLRTRRSGQQRDIEMHIVVPPSMTVAESHEVTERIESRIHQRWPKALVTIHVEPADGRFLGPLQKGANSHGREGEVRAG